MPRGDGTGPFGQGPFVGRGAGGSRGNCGGRFYASGTAGMQPNAYGPDPEPSLSREDEIALLKSEAGRLRSVLETIERRLEQLETS